MGCRASVPVETVMQLKEEEVGRTVKYQEDISRSTGRSCTSLSSGISTIIGAVGPWYNRTPKDSYTVRRGLATRDATVSSPSAHRSVPTFEMR